MRAAGAAALACILAAGRAGPAVGQALLTQPQRYLLTTEAGDGRALWVQPAGLARRHEASINLSVTAARTGDVTTLEQYGLTLASGGLGLGFQHAELVDGTDVNQYAVGFGVGHPNASLGFARRWMRGERVRAGAWDIGGRVLPSELLELSLVARDIGAPLVAAPAGVTNPQDTTYEATLVTGFALRLARARARLGADWELATAGWGTSAYRFGAAITLPLQLELMARAEFTPDLVRRDLAIAVTWNASAARATAFAAWPRGAGADSYGLWGSAVRDLDRPRRFGGR